MELNSLLSVQVDHYSDRCDMWDTALGVSWSNSNPNPNPNPNSNPTSQTNPTIVSQSDSVSLGIGITGLMWVLVPLLFFVFLPRFPFVWMKCYLFFSFLVWGGNKSVCVLFFYIFTLRIDFHWSPCRRRYSSFGISWMQPNRRALILFVQLEIMSGFYLLLSYKNMCSGFCLFLYVLFFPHDWYRSI